MTTKSDFAQKLLTDLRLRKERMAAAQHSNGSSSTRVQKDIIKEAPNNLRSHKNNFYSNSKASLQANLIFIKSDFQQLQRYFCTPMPLTPMHKGSNGNPGPAYKGSRQTKTYESVGIRSGNSSIRPTSNTKSLHLQDTSNQQLVPYAKGGSSGQIGDLSKAIALAFPNGGKLRKMDAAGSIPVLNFLQEIGKRTLGSGSIEIRSNYGTNSSNSHVITFSQVHISEISKGIQKLNQILKDSSNGKNLERYSTDVGKELLKGAVDLEKSLRMLANFNEASDYMINPRGKNKIKLLKDNEDDGSEDAKLNDLKQVERPRFSFDKPNKNSRHTKQAAKDIMKQQTPLTLTYPGETQILQEKQHQGMSKPAIHSRSASCIPEYTTISTQLDPENERISSHRQPQKPRTSNVIARLMGLEELPPKEYLKITTKVLNSHSIDAIASKGDITLSDLQPQHTKSKPPFTKSKDASRSLRTNADSIFTPKAEKNTSTVRGNSKVLIAEDDSYMQEFKVADRTSAGSVATIPATTVDKQQEIKVIQIDEDPGYRIISQETGKKYDNEEKEKKIKKTGKIDYPLLQEEMQHTAPVEHGGSEAEHVSERSEIKDIVKTGEQTTDSLLLSKQEKHMDCLNLQQQQQKVRKLDGVEEKRNLQHPKQKLLTRKPKENQQARLDKSKPKSSPRVLEKKQSCKLKNGKKMPVKQLEANVLPKSTFNKRHGLESAKGETCNHASIQHAKADERKRQIHRKLDATVNRRNLDSNHSARLQQPHSIVCQPMEQQNDKKMSVSGISKQGSNHELPEAISSQSSKPEVSSQTSNLAELPQKVAEDVTYCNPSREKDQSPAYYMDQAENNNSINNSEEAPEVTQDSQLSQQPLVCADDLSKEPTKASSPLHRGDDEVKAVVPHIVQNKHTRNNPTWSADQLTESEKHLKEILIKGQVFLHTAEALFKLNIPVHMLHGADHNDQVADTKLILDCGNELLMRKGRKRELAFYSFKEMSFDCAMIKSFDVLIKHLSKDLCHLKSYGGKWEEECDTAEYIYNMLEKDVNNKDPGVQSMWDFGWYEKTFVYSEKDELIKDVEKHMLRGLLDELTRDLLHT